MPLNDANINQSLKEDDHSVDSSVVHEKRNVHEHNPERGSRRRMSWFDSLSSTARVLGSECGSIRQTPCLFIRGIWTAPNLVLLVLPEHLQDISPLGTNASQ
eukprot:5276973-Amphidinium_carterae.1